MKLPAGLNVRMTLVVSLLVVVLLSAMAFLLHSLFASHFKETISRQQFTLISVIAEELDARIVDAHRTVIDSSQRLAAEGALDPRQAKRFLASLPEMERIFNNGIFLFSSGGEMLAEHPVETGRVGKDFSFREYFRVTVETGKPYVSRPYLSSQDHNHPAIMFTAPVFDRKGRLTAVLAGSVDLRKDGLLSRVSQTRIGRTGYLFLYDSDRTMIMHPDPGRIMKRDVPPGANRLFDRAIAGFEGTDENVNSRGLRALSSFKRLKATDWIIGANYPVAEAYAPFTQARNVIVLLLTLAVIVTISLVSFVMRYLTLSLQLFAHHVENLPEKQGAARFFAIDSRDEIGVLVRAFNRMVEELDMQRSALQKSELLHRTIIDTIPAPVFYKAPDGRYLGCNKAFLDHLGLRREEVIGRISFEVAPEDLAAVDHDTDDELVTEGGCRNYECQVRAADGTLLEMIVYKAAYRCGDGSLEGIVGTMLDITRRKQAEEELRKVSCVVQQSFVSVIVTDTAGAIEYVNPAFCALTGYGRIEVIGKTPRLLRSGETPPETYLDLRNTLAAGQAWRGEFRNRRRNGDLYWALASISPIRDAEGMVTHYVAIEEDVTGRKKLEAELSHSQKMEAVGRLAGGIAHDFNNILTAIIGYASLLEMQAGEESPLRNDIRQILHSAERGANLSQGLLAYSRKQTTNPQPVNVNEVVRRVEKLLARVIGEDVELRTALSSHDLVVMADSTQIERVLMNLATNSRDAMPGGGVLTIATDVFEMDASFISRHDFGRPGRYARLAIADTGMGMDEETARRIFEPYFTTKEVGKGTGLGLSMVYGIVKKHEGYILCHSSSGKGTVIDIYLPLVQSEPVDVLDRVPSQLARGGETILLAEDDPAVRGFAANLLARLGYTVIEAADGDEAIERFRESREEIRLLILDVVMPKRNGKDVYESVVELNPDVKVLFISGYTADIINRHGMLEEGIHFLEKPLAPAILAAKIREVLDIC